MSVEDPVSTPTFILANEKKAKKIEATITSAIDHFPNFPITQMASLLYLEPGQMKTINEEINLMSGKTTDASKMTIATKKFPPKYKNLINAATDFI